MKDKNPSYVLIILNKTNGRKGKMNIIYKYMFKYIIILSICSKRLSAMEIDDEKLYIIFTYDIFTSTCTYML